MNFFDGCLGKQLANGLTWQNEPADWRFTGKELLVVSRPRTDVFRSCNGNIIDNAAMLTVAVSDDFTAIAQTTVETADFADASGLIVRESFEKWFKLCLERNPWGEISTVSVVTDPWSDDCGGEIIARPTCGLRITRKGGYFGMHYNPDGSRWRFIRHFCLDMARTVQVGTLVQSPRGNGCRAEFRSFEIIPHPVADFRSGE
jgi:regulation of enolase protein 1 (concanavalin A-like superfamily)